MTYRENYLHQNYLAQIRKPSRPAGHQTSDPAQGQGCLR